MGGNPVVAALAGALPDDLRSLWEVLADLSGTPSPPPQVFAHRGGFSVGCDPVCPENTLEGFRRALLQGVHGLEFDLQMTSDGELVLHHDLKIELAGRGMPTIPSLSWAELSRVRLKSGGIRQPIPRFEDLVNLPEAAGCLLLPELKNLPEYRQLGRSEELIDRFCGEVERLGCAHRTIVQSFDLEALRAVQERLESVRRLALFGHSHAKVLATGLLAGELLGDPQYVGVPVALAAVTGHLMVSQAAEKERKVVAWREAPPAESPFFLSLLRRQGVHAVMVDDPDRALRVFGGEQSDLLDTLVQDLACFARMATSRRVRPGVEVLQEDHDVVLV